MGPQFIEINPSASQSGKPERRFLNLANVVSVKTRVDTVADTSKPPLKRGNTEIQQVKDEARAFVLLSTGQELLVSGTEYVMALLAALGINSLAEPTASEEA